jgi:CHAT domain-containing protein
MRGWRLAGARPRVERLSTRLHLALQTAAVVRHDRGYAASLGAGTRGLLASLYMELIGPLAASLDGVERLVIVPDGLLHRIPFAALHDGHQYLIQRHEIVVGPSASTLSFCRRPLRAPKERVLAVAHSDNGTLPGAIRESERVATLFSAECLIEADATRDRVKQGCVDADIIHLATHGYARIDAPLFSYLRLHDGHLTALDCFDLELDCALVTLSACETGWARIVAGDEQMGLPRAFLYAGAHSVLQTLWRVDDETMAILMERFYTGLRVGQGRAQALRNAQLELLEQDPGKAHPFFWAHAVLVGDWSPVRQKKA